MRTAIVSTYPPRACGIGAFAADVRAALLGVDGVDRVEKVVVVKRILPQFNGDPEWSTVIRTEHTVDAPWQEMAENGVDSAHFRFVHNTAEEDVFDPERAGLPANEVFGGLHGTVVDLPTTVSQAPDVLAAAGVLAGRRAAPHWLAVDWPFERVAQRAVGLVGACGHDDEAVLCREGLVGHQLRVARAERLDLGVVAAGGHPNVVLFSEHLPHLVAQHAGPPEDQNPHRPGSGDGSSSESRRTK